MVGVERVRKMTAMVENARQLRENVVVAGKPESWACWGGQRQVQLGVPGSSLCGIP